MQPPHQHSRINLSELQAQIVKRLGPERSKQYFYYLNRLLSLKLSKVEFNKICFQIFGRENVWLHNQFIHSILKNACHATIPPPQCHNKEVNVKSIGKVDLASPQSTITGDNTILENGDLDLCIFQKSMQHHQGLTGKGKNKEEVLLHQHPNPPLIKGLTDGSRSVSSKDQSEVSLVVEDGKEVSTRSPLRAPLGIPISAVTVGGVCRGLRATSSGICASLYDSGGLLDSATLRERMLRIAAARGLEGVSMDSANLLNNGLDAYLKRLIRSCTELGGATHRCDGTKNSTNKHLLHRTIGNGVLPGHPFQMQSGSRPLDVRTHYSVPLLHFKVAMELNPHQLGEDWPLLLEKICTHSFEE